MTTTLKKYIYYIGIDCGVQTGLAVWNKIAKDFYIMETVKIHVAMQQVKNWVEAYPGETFIRIEDARKRVWFGKAGPEQLQGAGSIKRDSKIWEDYLTYLKVDFEMVAPKNNKTKLDALKFKMITGYKSKTNEHCRDAAMLVYGL